MKFKSLIKICLISSLLLLLPFTGKCGITIHDIESLTLRLYNQQKWDSLLIVGENAIDNGIDYFYLRVRVGRAAFENKRYVRASKHLEKAVEFGGYEEYASYLLYKSYQYSSQTNKARLLLSKMPGQIALELGKPERMPLVYIEAGPAFTNHQEQYDLNKQTDPGLYSEVYLNRNSQYLLAGIAQPIKYRFGIQAAFARLNFNKTRIVNINGLDSLQGNYRVSEWEAYLSPSFILNKHFSITPAFRIINVIVDNPLKSSDSLVQRLIGPAVELNYNDYAAGGEVCFSSSFITATAGAWFMHIGEADFTQTSATFFVRPFGNLNLYTSTTLNLLSSDSGNEYILHQMIGGRIFGNLWGEAFYTWGNLANSAEQNLQVVYNSFEKVNTRAGSRLILNINDYLKLSLRYQIFFREGTELFYGMDATPGIYSYHYINQSITGGITWNLH